MGVLLLLGVVACGPLQAAQHGGGLSGGAREDLRVHEAGRHLVHPHVFREHRSTQVTSQGETVVENQGRTGEAGRGAAVAWAPRGTSIA